MGNENKHCYFNRVPRKNPKQQYGVLQMVERIQKRRHVASSESPGWRNLGGRVQPTGQYVMKVRRKCARASLMLYAKKSLKSNQITAQGALMEPVWARLCGTQNLHRLEPRASAGRTQCWVYIIDSPVGTAALTAVCTDRSGQGGSKGRKDNFIGLLQLPPS